ncbi:hypothetical protein [Commensalibacter communis]|uniref:hypothetical protein n=1 Tax=Commensalibacter communis TaxID=2972786 RepID=UPI0022FFA502|nr:hypothetical protein [Commensalibacter communis]CAI3952514.1 unnamed protein product [Commensalibacter communis]CAI3953910.1 unnamed protein product [Commensalibacter communis]
MAEFTGFFYSFYSNKPIETIFELFKKEVKTIGYQWDYHEYQNERNLLFYKNKAMLEYHLEHGYNTDLYSEGCFGLEVKLINLHGKASFTEHDGVFESYLSIDDIFHYLLVLPDEIEQSEFSVKIHQLFMRCMTKNYY